MRIERMVKGSMWRRLNVVGFYRKHTHNTVFCIEKVVNKLKVVFEQLL